MPYPHWRPGYDREVADWWDRLAPHEWSPAAGIVAKLTYPSRLARYLAVAEACRVPWALVGVIHYLEANLSFKAHLHNGDPLRGADGRFVPTVMVPADRPPAWFHRLPESLDAAWTDSAIDALATKLAIWRPEAWRPEAIAYFLEQYNGFGYHRRQRPSPYLWAGADDCPPGKYVADGVWDPEAVSAQIGGMLILKAAWHLCGDMDLWTPPKTDVARLQRHLDGSLTYMPSLAADGTLGARTAFYGAEVARKAGAS